MWLWGLYGVFVNQISESLQILRWIDVFIHYFRHFIEKLMSIFKMVFDVYFQIKFETLFKKNAIFK